MLDKLGTKNINARVIEEIWKDNIAEKKWGFKPGPDDTHFFLCGNPRMIESMKDTLLPEGFTVHSKKSPGQIHIEEF